MRIYAHHPLVRVCSAAAIAVAIAACGEGSSEEIAVEAAGAAMPAPTDAPASCIADYAERPCDLLTADLVRAELPGSPPDIEQSSYTGSMFSTCSYTWPSDRMGSREVMGQTIEYAEDNLVRLSWIKTYDHEDPAARFRREYLPTEEEIQQGREMLEERLDEQVAEGEMTEEQRAIAEGLTDAAAGGLSFQLVDGVGDLASWSGGTLHVLDGATAFQVELDISTDSDEDRAAAIEIANALMAACR